MATLDAAAIELANSLSVEAVPAKLRCGSCNKLAINAVKLPCCDQSICELCSQDLPESCPICGHSPLSADDCKPNKSLRMTVKAFIKSEEKKRSKETETPLPQPTATPVQAVSETPAPITDVAQAIAQGSALEGEGEHPSALGSGQSEALPGETVASVETSTEADIGTMDASREMDVGEQDSEEQDDDDDDDDDDDVIITTEKPEEESAPVLQEEKQHVQNGNENASGMGQMQMNGDQNFGFDSNQQGFGNMDFNAMNFNPMMAMQNGMGMGNFPMGMPNMLGMPGMPGMNMDPSMMFGGGNGNGFGGMNMNDMNMMSMAMGMGGMGGFGGGMGGGMNESQAGFFPGQGGYNHQNFGSHQMNQSFPSNRGYGRPYGRGGYGRGRGGYGYRVGRGGWQNFPNQQQQHQGPPQYMNHQNQHQGQSFPTQAENMNVDSHAGGPRGSPSYEPMRSADGTVNDSNVVPRQNEDVDATDHSKNIDTNKAGETASNETAGPEGPQNEIVSATQRSDQQDDTAEMSTRERAHRFGNETGHAKYDQNDTEVNGHDFNHEQQQPQTFEAQSHKHGGFPNNRAGFQASSAYGNVATTVVGAEPSPPPAPPINAPTGPKAMRAGLPNSGFYSRTQTQSAATPMHQAQGDAHSRRESVAGTEITRLPDHGERQRSKSPSRSRSRHRSHRHRDHSGDDYESEKAYERRKERERRKRHDRERNAADDDGRANGSGKGHSHSEEHEDRHGRDREEEGRSSRSHRQRSRDKRRNRDRSKSPDKNGDSTSHHESRHKSSKSERRRGDRSKDRERERDRTKSRRESSRDESHRRHEKHRSRNSSSHRERDRERDRAHRKPVLEQPEDDIGFKIKGGSRKHQTETSSSQAIAPPTGPRNHHDRSADRRPSTASKEPSSAVMAPSDPPLDSYAAERQAREQARMERHRSQLAQSEQRSTSLGKRGERDDDDGFDAPTGPKGYSDQSGRRKKSRPMSYKYEDEIRDGYEDTRDRKRWR